MLWKYLMIYARHSHYKSTFGKRREKTSKGLWDQSKKTCVNGWSNFTVKLNQGLGRREEVGGEKGWEALEESREGEGGWMEGRWGERNREREREEEEVRGAMQVDDYLSWAGTWQAQHSPTIFYIRLFDLADPRRTSKTGFLLGRLRSLIRCKSRGRCDFMEHCLRA